MYGFESHSSAYVLIVGCGRLGARIAGTLSDHGCSVLILDQDASSFRKLPVTYGGLTQVGDAESCAVLEEAQITRADVLIAVTNHDNANAMIAQMARDIYHVPHIIARMYDPDQAALYEEFGIDTVCPAALSTQAVFERLKSGWNTSAKEGA